MKKWIPLGVLRCQLTRRIIKITSLQATAAWASVSSIYGLARFQSHPDPKRTKIAGVSRRKLSILFFIPPYFHSQAFGAFVPIGHKTLHSFFYFFRSCFFSSSSLSFTDCGAELAGFRRNASFLLCSPTYRFLSWRHLTLCFLFCCIGILLEGCVSMEILQPAFFIYLSESMCRTWGTYEIRDRRCA